MLKFTFLGTADSAQLPVYNCDCAACQRAQQDPTWRRRPASALLQTEQGAWLIDSGLPDITERFAPGTLQGIFKTHYHADHAQGLLHLRWGVNMRLPVYGPDDVNGFADLYKHPGILDFSRPFKAFETRQMSGFTVTALPLVHSKLTYGYVFISDSGRSIAYLTDTVGLSEEVMEYLARLNLDVMIIDCTYQPLEKANRNHNDITIVLALQQVIQAKTVILTHISHSFDCWLMQHAQTLPPNFQIAQDNLGFTLA